MDFYMEDVQSVSAAAETIEETTKNGASAAEKGNMAQWFSSFGATALNYLIRIGIGILILFVLWKVLKKITGFIDRRMSRKNVDASVRGFITSLVRWIIMLLAVVEVCIWLNIVEASTIAAIVAAAGVGISLAIQGTLSNFAGGILILLTRPFRVGAYIRVPAVDAEGTVRKIDMYYTTIETMLHERVSIPNSSLTNNQVTNISSDGRRYITVSCGISYSADIQKARKIMEHLLKEDPRVDDSHASVVVTGLDSSQVTMQMKAPVRTEDYWQVTWDMNERVKLAFDEAGIEIPYSQLDIHIRHDAGTDENPAFLGCKEDGKVLESEGKC